jgi:hypothetical protein
MVTVDTLFRDTVPLMRHFMEKAKPRSLFNHKTHLQETEVIRSICRGYYKKVKKKEPSHLDIRSVVISINGQPLVGQKPVPVHGVICNNKSK